MHGLSPNHSVEIRSLPLAAEARHNFKELGVRNAEDASYWETADGTNTFRERLCRINHLKGKLQSEGIPVMENRARIWGWLAG